MASDLGSPAGIATNNLIQGCIRDDGKLLIRAELGCRRLRDHSLNTTSMSILDSLGRRINVASTTNLTRTRLHWFAREASNILTIPRLEQGTLDAPLVEI
jgi:hypothetical protein